jgi:hypothetical protein
MTTFHSSLEWTQAYKECLQLVLPYELKLRYNNTASYRPGEPKGCIDAANVGDKFVIVILDEKDTKDETLERTCKRGGPKECDEDCQQYFPETDAPSAAP